MKNSSPKLFTRFWSMLRPDTKEIRNIYLFSVLSGILSLGLPLGIQMIINFIELGQMSTSWFVLVLLVVLSLGFSGVLNIFQLRITENLQQRIFTRSAFEFAERIPHIKLTELLKKYATDLTHRFFDTLTIQKGLSKLLIDFTASILQLVFCLILLSFYHSFFIFLGVFLVFTLILIVRFTVQRGMQTSLEESSYKYKIAHWLKEVSQARFSFGLSGKNKLHISRTDSHLNGYLTARDEHFKVLVKQYIYLIVFKVIIALVFLIIGGLLVINQQMNIGQFVASEIIILLVLSAVEKLILSVEVVYDVLTAIEKISQVTDLELEDEMSNGYQLASSEGFSVQLENVSYHIQDFDMNVLSNISCQIKQNEKVCIVSDSSVSSNLLFHLIVGLTEPGQGTISFNELPLENLNKEFLRGQIGAVVDQDLLIFGSVIDNISFGRNHIDLKRIEEEVAELELKPFIQALPHKYESVLNADVQFIPRDIVKKILIARAMIGDPRLVLLEEPSAGLTSRQKNTILNRILKENQSTLIVASSDLEVIRRFPRIIEIFEGAIVFDGNYETFKLKNPC
jgi:ABC-type bacteriocin/lantibiotic exporter with double-glycine peptidase domain